MSAIVRWLYICREGNILGSSLLEASVERNVSSTSHQHYKSHLNFHGGEANHPHRITTRAAHLRPVCRLLRQMLCAVPLGCTSWRLIPNTFREGSGSLFLVRKRADWRRSRVVRLRPTDSKANSSPRALTVWPATLVSHGLYCGQLYGDVAGCPRPLLSVDKCRHVNNADAHVRACYAAYINAQQTYIYCTALTSNYVTHITTCITLEVLKTQHAYAMCVCLDVMCIHRMNMH